MASVTTTPTYDPPAPSDYRITEKAATEWRGDRTAAKRQLAVVEVVARRGDDGLLGIDVMDDPSRDIFNVVVAIAAGSAARLDHRHQPH